MYYYLSLIKKSLVYSAVVLLLATYVLPIFPLPLRSFYQEFIVVTSFLLTVLAFSLSKRYWCINLTVLVVVLVSIIPVLQFFTGVIYFDGDVLLSALYLLISAVALSYGQQLMKQHLRNIVLLYFLSVFFALSFVNVFFALNQFLQLPREFISVAVNRPYGNLLQPNNFSTLLMVSLVGGWYLFEKDFLSRKVYCFWIFFLVIGLVLAQSRTTLLTAILLFTFYCTYRSKIQFKHSFCEWLWLLLCYLLWYFILPEIKQLFVPETVKLREMVIYDNARMDIWYEALLAILQGPLWGYGWNQIGVAQVLVDSPLESIVHFRHTHNLFLDLLLYNGPIIGLALIAGIVLLIWQGFRACNTLEGWIILAIIGVIFTHAMLEFPLHYAYFLLPAAFLIGLMDRDSVSITSRPVFTYPSYYNIPIVIAAGVILWLTHKDYQIIHKEHFKLRVEVNGVFTRQPDKEKTNDIILLTQWRNNLHYGRAKATAGMSDTDIHWMKQVSHRYANPYYLSKYAKACQLNGREQEAKRVLAVIKRLFGQEMYAIAKGQAYE